MTPSSSPSPVAYRDPFGDAHQVEGQRVGNQIGALFRKSYLVQKRQYKTNLCQLLFPLAMMLLLWALQLFVNSLIEDQYGKFFPAVENPPLLPPYLMFWNDNADKCTASSSTSDSLARILVSDQGSGLLAATNLLSMFTYPSVGGIANGYYAIGARKSFDRGSQAATKCQAAPVIATKLDFVTAPNLAAIDQRLYEGWGKNDSFLGGFLLKEATDNSFKYDILVNQSFTDLYDMPGLSSAVANAVYRTLVSRNGTRATPTAAQMMLTGTKSFPTVKTKIEFDLISLIGPSIYIYLFSMLLPVFMYNLVSEKESQIRELMEMMGLRKKVHFLVAYAFNYALYLMAMAFLVAIACLLGFRYFLVNSFWAYFILLFLWGHVLCAAAFLLSSFFTKSKTATVVGYLLVFGLGLIASTLMRNFFASSTTSATTLFFIQLVPNFALFRALDTLRDGVSFGSQGLSMADLQDKDVSLAAVYVYFICEWAAILVLVYIFETFGSPGELLKHGYRSLRRPSAAEPKQREEDGSVVVSVTEQETADDVVGQIAAANDESVPVAVRVQQLRKVYKGYGGLRDKIAVKDLSMVVKYGECLGFLGSNGAGKTTTISMLCGYVKPSSGTAKIFGKDIVDEMDAIHTVMGVCPQENVIWGELSGGEHLEFFGRLKGLQGDELEQAVVNGLRDVELLSVRHKFAMQYSGGMKRRLCVAIAFMGRPSIVLLDEPTTGLDPAARRNLWSVICRYKKQCALMLTTHSMEEAEHLCDRVGIFERGSLCCIGTSSNLKQRFEQGYKLTLTTDTKHESEIDLVVRRLSPDAVQLNKLGGVLTYEVPCATTELSVVFREMEAQKQSLGIVDWCITNTTLEEVFVRIATGKYAGKTGGVVTN